MSSDDCNAGIGVGLMLALLIMFILYHGGEGACQYEHDVADCTLKEEIFEPVKTTGVRE
jgi:hypothetical protein